MDKIYIVMEDKYSYPAPIYAFFDKTKAAEFVHTKNYKTTRAFYFVREVPVYEDVGGATE